jgi:hypothetical protein
MIGTNHNTAIPALTGSPASSTPQSRSNNQPTRTEEKIAEAIARIVLPFVEKFPYRSRFRNRFQRASNDDHFLHKCLRFAQVNCNKFLNFQYEHSIGWFFENHFLYF